MFAAILLALREGIEIALVIGVVLGTLKQMNRPDLRPVLWYGVAAASAISLAAALILNWLGAEFEGRGEQIFEGSAMLLAAGLLTWMIFWMRRNNAKTKSAIEAHVRESSAKGRLPLFLIAVNSVLRDGIELALFLLAAQFASAPLQTFSGAILGLAIAAFLGWGLFTSTIHLNIRRFFTVTNILLILFAAGLIGRGIHELNEAMLIPAGIDQLWNISMYLSEESLFGQLLTALFGYSSSPSLSMTAGYLIYLVVMLRLFWYGKNPKQRALPA